QRVHLGRPPPEDARARTVGAAELLHLDRRHGSSLDDTSERFTAALRSPRRTTILERKAPGVRRASFAGTLALILGLLVTASAVAASPSATTGPTTAVGPTSATVTGSVNPGGQATTSYVEYGKTTSYGSKTSSLSAGSGSATVAVSVGLTGLGSGTTYH